VVIMNNTYNPSHKGHLPIRVLQHNIIHQFENTTHNFLDESASAIKKFGLKKEIVYTVNRSSIDGCKVEGPYVHNLDKQIYIQETFLSYLWCMCYSLHMYTDKIIASPDPCLSKEIKTKELFEYALSLQDKYSDWSKSQLANPECYTDQDAADIERTNELFLYAFNFILCHEFAHVVLGHSPLRQNSCRLKFLEKIKIEISDEKIYKVF